MYRILQLINNNVALVKDEHHDELMVTGNGIAFQKKKGDLIIEKKIDKIFRLNSTESKENLLTLLKGVPLDFITVTYDVIDSLSIKYHYLVQEYLYVTLTDHIYCSYQAVRKGIYQESRLPDVSSEYQTEYQMAREALDVFKDKLLASFPDDEIGRIALHFINAKRELKPENLLKINQTKEILTLVENELKRNRIQRTKENSHFYDRFMIHLNYFLDYIDRSHDDNLSLLEMKDHIRQSYPEAYEIGSQIYNVIVRETGVDFYQSERVYIVLHIQRLL